MTSARPATWFHLRQDGCSILVVRDDNGVPVVHHWGPDLGELSEDAARAVATGLRRTVTHSSLDRPRVVGLLPEAAAGFSGMPALSGHRTGEAASAFLPRFVDWEVTVERDEAVLTSEDTEVGLGVECRIAMAGAGVLRLEYVVTNGAPGDFMLASLYPSLPIASRAREVLDLTGRWCRERAPQRHPLRQGAWMRAARHGRTGHDATLLLAAGTPGFTFGAGEVWAVHVAWSGDHLSYAELTPEGDAHLGGGELLAPGEVVLAPGEGYTAPALLAVWSDQGMDGLSVRLHAYVRSKPHLEGRPRPVVLNTWEAVYFEHDEDTLVRLADIAADLGVERFVLDDGWFEGRTSDHTGLGDWRVDAGRWPEGLHPLVEHVHARGMEFGLWVEPEMVNVDSDLARRHPDWILRGRSDLPPSWRNQQVLDLQHPDAYAHVRDALNALLDEYDIAYLKWDHNRDLIDVTHAGRHAVHGQTAALYRLLDELTSAHPLLEIESCASGGGRVDLGILERTHRVWPSDTNDALERQNIQRWTQLLLPPELVGAHVGAPVAHTTGRTHRLSFRAATSLIGHFGIEWDLLAASPEQLDELAAWVAAYKQVRPIVTSGRLVRGDHPDPALLVTGVVARDGSAACFVLAQVASAQTTRPVPVVLPGLDPSRTYRVERLGPAPGGPLVDLGTSWLDEGPLSLPGSALVSTGVQLPVLAPESARVLLLTAL